MPFRSNDEVTNQVNQEELDSAYLNVTGDTMRGNINMNLNKIINLATPINPGDAATKVYVDAATNNCFKLQKDSVGSVDTNVDFNNIGIFNLRLLNTTLESNLDCNQQTLENVKEPENPSDAATKLYVDKNKPILFTHKTNRLNTATAVVTVEVILPQSYDDVERLMISLDAMSNFYNTVPTVGEHSQTAVSYLSSVKSVIRSRVLSNNKLTLVIELSKLFEPSIAGPTVMGETIINGTVHRL
jgi:hypothetical protein